MKFSKVYCNNPYGDEYASQLSAFHITLRIFLQRHSLNVSLIVLLYMTITTYLILGTFRNKTLFQEWFSSWKLKTTQIDIFVLCWGTFVCITLWHEILLSGSVFKGNRRNMFEEVQLAGKGAKCRIRQGLFGTIHS